jgi:hypothetical protein
MKPLIQLITSHGALRSGSGLLTGVIALVLAVLSVLSVLAFHFPEYLTTPEVRRRLDIDVLRRILFAALVIAGGFSVLNFVRGHRRWLATISFSLVLLAAALGGHAVPVDPNFPNNTPYIGLDWFVLDCWPRPCCLFSLRNCAPFDQISQCFDLNGKLIWLTLP